MEVYPTFWQMGFLYVLGKPLSEEPFSYDEIVTYIVNQKDLVSQTGLKIGCVPPSVYSYLKLTNPEVLPELVGKKSFKDV